jgi:hypothetical protein
MSHRFKDMRHRFKDMRHRFKDMSHRLENIYKIPFQIIYLKKNILIMATTLPVKDKISKKYII